MRLLTLLRQEVVTMGMQRGGGNLSVKKLNWHGLMMDGKEKNSRASR